VLSQRQQSQIAVKDDAETEIHDCGAGKGAYRAT